MDGRVSLLRFQPDLDQAADGRGNELGARRFGTALLFSEIRRNGMRQKNADTEQRDRSDK
jgi:hypothetical protein